MAKGILNRLFTYGRSLGSSNKKKNSCKEDIKALDEFIQQIYWGESISEEESKENIKSNIVQIHAFKIKGKASYHSYSNGLLITENGYFLTAKHCVMFDDPAINFKTSDLRIIDNQGDSYEIERVCAAGKFKKKENRYIDEDIALVKAKIDKKPKSIKYRIYNTDQLTLQLSLCLLAYDNQRRLNKKYGKIIDLSNKGLTPYKGQHINYATQFSTDIDSKSGDSGGSIISPDGRLTGFVSTGDAKGTNYTGIVKIFRAFELITFYKKILESHV